MRVHEISIFILGGLLGVGVPSEAMAEVSTQGWVLWSKNQDVSGLTATRWDVTESADSRGACLTMARTSAKELGVLLNASRDVRTAIVAREMIAVDYKDGSRVAISFVCLPSGTDPRPRSRFE